MHLWCVEKLFRINKICNLFVLYWALGSYYMYIQLLYNKLNECAATTTQEYTVKMKSEWNIFTLGFTLTVVL